MRPTFIATSFLIKNNPNGPNNSKITVTCTTNFKCKINDTKTKKQTKKQTRKQVSKISKAKVHFARNMGYFFGHLKSAKSSENGRIHSEKISVTIRMGIRKTVELEDFAEKNAKEYAF